MKKFIFGVARAIGMVQNSNGGWSTIFDGKTLINDGIEVTTESKQVRGGNANALQGIYYHTTAMNVTLTDSQWNLPLIALSLGQSVNYAGTSNIWATETVAINNNAGTLVGTAVGVTSDATPVVYIDIDGVPATYAVSTGGHNFATTGLTNGNYCVNYLKSNTGTTLNISTIINPATIRLFLIANEYGDVTGTGAPIGTVNIEIPLFKFDGSATINLAADGTCETPAKGMALAYTSSVTGCDDSVYAIITENISSSNWYDDVTALAIQGGNFTSAVSSTTQLTVLAVVGGFSFVAPLADLTFTASGGTGITVGSHNGIVTTTASATGTSTITVVITGKTSIEAVCTCTIA